MKIRSHAEMYHIIWARQKWQDWQIMKNKFLMLMRLLLEENYTITVGLYNVYAFLPGNLNSIPLTYVSILLFSIL